MSLPDSRDRTVPVSRAPSFYADLPKGRRESSMWLWLSLPESFFYRISWILREVMVGLIIRFTRATFIKDILLVLPCCLGLLGLGRAGSPCVLKEQQRETDAHYSRGIRNQLADPVRRCNPFPSQDGACGESSS